MVLITGATGLLGSYLARLLLSKGEQVRAIKRSTSDTSLLGAWEEKIEWVEADVLDIPALQDAMTGVTQLYHCAAVISHIASEADYMMKINVEGTANVMNVALSAGVSKVVHVSSIAALGIAPKAKVIDENYSDPNINKCFWYYKSKHYGEREVWRAQAEGLPVVVVNPSTILGAGFWNTLPNSLFSEVYRGLKFYNDSLNGFVDVRDVARCMHALMNSPIVNERFIVSAENLSFREVLWMMADALHVKRPGIKAGHLLLQIAWIMEAVKGLVTGTKPTITKESIAIASVPFRYSNQKICEALPYRFYPVKKTIEDTAAAFLESEKKGLNFGILPI